MDLSVYTVPRGMAPISADGGAISALRRTNSDDVFQKEQADAKCREYIDSYGFGDQVLLNAKKLPTNVVSAVFKTKLRPRFINPFTVIAKKGLACKLNLPRKLHTQPVFYFGLLKPYHDPSLVD